MTFYASKKTLDEWLTMIESFHPDEIELGLERITQLANKLDLIKQTAKVITVGGTNGKGSCVATLESLALQSNLRIGCYTSPHLLKFNERIRVNGNDISDQNLRDAFEKIDRVRESLALTFFEFTTLVALLIFKQASLDLILLEVGMGGRLDAVNIVEPDATIITTIELDHQSWLGNSLEDIAFEKSGICRKGIKNFIGDEKSFQLISKVRPDFVSEITLIDCNDREDDIYSQLSAIISDQSINPYRLLLQNLALAFRTFQSIFAEDFFNLDLKNVIKKINIKGRFQKISENPLVIVDVGHNVQAAINLTTQIKKLNKNSEGKRFAICGMMADKAIGNFLKIMDEVIDQWYFVDLPIERAAKAQKLQADYKKQSLDKHTHIDKSVQKACQKINKQISKDDQVFIFGSFITVAEMLDLAEHLKN